MSAFYVAIGSWDHEGDDFEACHITATVDEAMRAIDAAWDGYDDYRVYECKVGEKPKCLLTRQSGGIWH